MALTAGRRAARSVTVHISVAAKVTTMTWLTSDATCAIGRTYRRATRALRVVPREELGQHGQVPPEVAVEIARDVVDEVGQLRSDESDGEQQPVAAAG